MSFLKILRRSIPFILIFFAFYAHAESLQPATVPPDAQTAAQTAPATTPNGAPPRDASAAPDAPSNRAGQPRRHRDNAITSDELYQTLKTNGLQPTVLVNTSLSPEFPYNVLADIAPEKTAPSNDAHNTNAAPDQNNTTSQNGAQNGTNIQASPLLTKAKSIVSSIYRRIFTKPTLFKKSGAANTAQTTADEKRFVIAVSQDDARFFLDELISYAKTLQQNPPPCKVTFLFTALETAALPTVKSERVATGTRTFIASLESNDVTVLILKPARAQQTMARQNAPRQSTLLQNGALLNIVPGVPQKVAPSWLLEQMLIGAEESGIWADIRGTFLSLYRIGFISRDTILGEYLENDIPSLLLECASPTVTQSFNGVIEYFAAHEKREWDLHYSHFRFNGKHFFISEHVLLSLLLIFSFVPLLDLSLFSFFNVKLRPFHLSDLKQSWYLIPLVIGVTCVLLEAGQIITYAIYPAWQSHPFGALLLKGFIAILLLAVVSVFHRFIPFPTRSFIYGWHLLLIAYADIFIFALFDVSLTMLFCAQLFIALLFLRAKHAYTLIPLGLLMLLPFVPFVTALFTLPRQNIFGRFFDTTFLENLLIACLVLPAEFTWMKILVSLKVFGKNSKVNFPYFVTLLSLLSILVIVCVLTGRFIPEGRFFRNTNQKQEQEIIESAESNLSITHEKSTFLDRTRIDVLIQSEKPILCIDVSVHDENSIAVYDANFPFESLNANKTAVFLLDDYPPNPLKIEYTCETKSNSCVTIDAYLQDGESVLHEKKAVYP